MKIVMRFDEGTEWRDNDLLLGHTYPIFKRADDWSWVEVRVYKMPAILRLDQRSDYYVIRGTDTVFRRTIVP